MPTSETLMPGLSHLIPNDVEGDELGLTRTDDPTPLYKLLDFDNDYWAGLYDGQCRKHRAEESVICEVLSQGAMTNEGVEVDVYEITSDILMAQILSTTSCTLV